MAQFDYDAADSTELGFKAGDIILVSKIDDSGWWEGTLNGVAGIVAGALVLGAVTVVQKLRKC